MPGASAKLVASPRELRSPSIINNAVEVLGPCERPRAAVDALVFVTAHEWAHETFPSLHAHCRGIEVDAVAGCSAEAAGFRS